MPDVYERRKGRQREQSMQGLGGQENSEVGNLQVSLDGGATDSRETR